MDHGPRLTREAQPPARGSAVKVVAVLGAIVVLSTALCVGAIFGVRHYRAEHAAAAADSAAASGAPSAPPVPTLRAVVTLPAGQPRAVMRATPAFDGAVVGFVPAGAVVEMTNTVKRDDQIWCRVRTTSGPQLHGWMHSGILKQQ